MLGTWPRVHSKACIGSPIQAFCSGALRAVEAAPSNLASGPLLAIKNRPDLHHRFQKPTAQSRRTSSAAPCQQQGVLLIDSSCLAAFELGCYDDLWNGRVSAKGSRGPGSVLTYCPGAKHNNSLPVSPAWRLSKLTWTHCNHPHGSQDVELP